MDEISIDQIRNAKTLEELDQLLTRAMAGKKIHALIKNNKKDGKQDNLSVVTEAIMSIAGNSDEKHKFLAAAILGRLAASARSRAPDVLKKIPVLITTKPPSFDIFSDSETIATDKDNKLGKVKQYAAQSLRCLDADWLPEYCVREGVNMDLAEKARDELLSIALEKYKNMGDWMIAISNQSQVLDSIEKNESRLKRVQRIFKSILQESRKWEGNPGHAPCEALENLFSKFAHGKSCIEEKSEILNSAILILLRIIGLRLSHALYAKNYALIAAGKRVIGAADWSDFLQKYPSVINLRICLLEAALVLARQRQTDKQTMAVIELVHLSRTQTCSAIKHHFKDAKDLEPDIHEWWCSAGEPTVSRREVTHEFDNTADEEIGMLLLEIKTRTESVEKLGNDLVPMLEKSDPDLANAAKKIVGGFTQIAQTTRRLARMRKIDTTELTGMVIQYNRNEHSMLGGHQSGVRNVKVMRDGVTKEFGGRKQTLVKSWVEPKD